MADYSISIQRRHRPRLIRAATIATTALLAAALLAPASSAIAAGGNLDHYVGALVQRRQEPRLGFRSRRWTRWAGRSRPLTTPCA